ncbi:MAG: bifunctional phosphoglucose/phosphomannose isomerase, partial [Candidatus Thermoplasmatota archaeon]|nr:bifunctional phosphoglucose/phosphomannose isomerase [Candidatus Thermoplasmatota archaeon]
MLDSMEGVGAVDRKNMMSSVERLPKDLSEGLRRGRVSGLPRFSPKEVVFCGVGGSAIGGEMLREWVASSCPVRCAVIRDYSLPAHVGKDSLVIVSSYSGNTEETLSMFEDARRKRAKILAVSSNGQLAKMSESVEIPFVRVPSGLMPRASMGYMFGAMLGALERSGIVSVDKQVEEAIRVMERTRACCKQAVRTPDNPAKMLAHEMYSHLPVVIGYGISKPVAKRWADQLSENGKSLAFSLELPELDHNAIVGLVKDQRSKGLACVFLQHDGAGKQMDRRVVATKEMIARVAPVYSTDAMGLSPLAKMFSLIMMGDYVSVYLSVLRNEDPSANDVIDELKGILSKK